MIGDDGLIDNNNVNIIVEENNNINNINDNILIDLNNIIQHRIRGTKWSTIAFLLGCTLSQLKYWRKQNNFVDPLLSINDADLKEVIGSYINNGDDSRGEVLTMGYLLG